MPPAPTPPGWYEFKLYPGSYTLEVKHPCYVTWRGAITLAPRQLLQMDINLQPRIDVSIMPDHLQAGRQEQTEMRATVVDAEGRPLPQKRVTFTSSSGILANSEVETDAEGVARTMLSAVAAEPGWGWVKASVGECGTSRKILFHKVEVTNTRPCHILYNPENAEMANPEIVFTLRDIPAIAEEFKVTISIYTMENSEEPIARRVYNLSPGEHSVRWSDFFDQQGEGAAGRIPDPGLGIYAYQVEANVAKISEAATQGIISKACAHADWRASKTLRVESYSVELLDNEDLETTDLDYEVNVTFANDTANGPGRAKVTVYNYDLAEVTSAPLAITGKTATARLTIPNEQSAGAHFVIDAEEGERPAEGADAGKPALEVNWFAKDQLHIWVDENYTPDSFSKAYWSGQINADFPDYYNVVGVFERVAGITAVLRTRRRDPGFPETVRPHRGAPLGEVRAYRLDAEQQGHSRKRTVIVQIRSGLGNENHPGVSFPFAMTPGRPAITIINPDAVEASLGDDPGLDTKMALTLVAIHELTHIANAKDYDGSNPNHHSKLPGVNCVYDAVLEDYFAYPSGIRHRMMIEGKLRESPWHSLEEINAMRRNMGYRRLNP